MKAFFAVIFPFIMLAGYLQSCDVKKSDTDPSAEFTRIYDHTDINLSFHPVDLEQTTDGGFLILSVYTDTILSTFPLIHVLKTDKNGSRMWETWVDKAYSSAVPSLMLLGNNYHFVCMDAVNQETMVMRIDLETHEVVQTSSLSLQYPLYTFKDSNGDILMLNFDRLNRTSILSRFNSSFEEVWSHQFNIVDDVKHKIEMHLSKTGKQFPFFIGEAGSSAITHYFVNCFFNYTMTMLFVGAPAGNQTGILYTYQDDAAVSAAASIEDNRFSLARYYSGDNFVNPAVELDLAAMMSITDYPDFSLPELVQDAPIKCLHAEINGKDLVVYASQTRTNQLVLYFYDAVNGELQSVKFLNEKYPVNLSAMEYTQEEGLALLVQTYVIGRFPRIYLLKLSPDDLVE
jgi:hypothetical protein